MCGIAGFWTADDKIRAFDTIIRRMTDAVTHRGPDDAGYWIDDHAGFALGHRRLSIIDLSAEGRQPMVSPSGRYIISFNGEVYNFGALRKELNGVTWRGHSDTEVMLAAIEQWGIRGAVTRFIGMFAFALWDRQELTLHLVRDRLGIKPLYFGWAGKTFLFGSELKALRMHPAFVGDINRDALALYLRHNYIPGPYSVFKNIHKLRPGTMLTLGDVDEQPLIHTYWSVKEVAERGVANPFRGDAQEAIARLDEILRDAVRLRMLADVPLGAFFSGGIDSSVVVALMQAQSERPVKTFTIGFHETEYNEAEHARAVAQHIGTEHTELYVTPEEAMQVIPRLPVLYDEPFADVSQIPTFLVSELARQRVTVSLSGDGGDELFFGYSRYNAGWRLWREIGWMPSLGRQILARSLTAVPIPLLNRGLWWLAPMMRKYGYTGSVGDKLHKLAPVLAIDQPEYMYLQLVSRWKDPTALVLGSSEPPTALTDSRQWARLPDFRDRMMYLDTMMYLPDDILTKVDRASMAVSLEARVPLLDHRVVEFAWQLPFDKKYADHQNKWLLRQVLYQYVPKSLLERPKKGFGVPIGDWLRDPLRDWAESLLDVQRLRREGLFDPQPIHEKWLEHISGKRDWHYYIWGILMFQAWSEAYHK